jgi:hypothetical protein
MNRCRPVMSLVVGGSFPVRMACPGCDPWAAVSRLVGGQAPHRDAPLDRPRPEPEREAKAQGKIKGRGTGVHRKPCLHMGEGGTYREWQRAVGGAECAPTLRLVRASFAGLRCAWSDRMP